MIALEKLDPDKNSLALVPKEITSSTLTTRLRGVCKINRLIDHSNDLCHSFNEIGAQDKFQECIEKFRDWILNNKIIEHIFGPNCHVEIIKQSHTILNFVAYSLNDEHVNVIWSASLLKHCGRQVLDLLTSLIRSMRTGPVLHLYWLVKNLNIEDHSEHTLLLTSHILRYIWSHSPCINQIQFCTLQKNRQQQSGQDESSNAQIVDQDIEQQYFLSHFKKQKSLRQSQRFDQSQHQAQQHQPQHLNSPNCGETIAKGGDDVKKSVVNHILRSISADSPADGQSTTRSETNNEGDWLKPSLWKVGNDFLDNTSDASACCSEDKNMNDFDDDFDDDAQEFIQDENTNGTDEPCANRSSSDIYGRNVHHSHSPQDNMLDYTTKPVSREPVLELDSSSTSRDSESKSRISMDQGSDSYQQISAENITNFIDLKKASLHLSSITYQICADDDLKCLSEYNLANLCDPDRTLLWDLLQDGKIEQLSTNLHIEVENVLVNLVMSFGDKYIRYKFIEACLENLSVGTSVIISLRLLPKLMSYNTITRNLSIPAINETYTIVLWAEREHNMSQNFFKNLVDYYKQQQCLQSKIGSNMSQTACINTFRSSEDLIDPTNNNPIFSHSDKIITRMSFLSFIYSKSLSPVTMKVNREQMDQLWDCLANDNNLRCSDILFQWIYQQAVSDDFHGIDEELLDYILKNKLPTLQPEHFRLRALKLLEQLLWIRQDYECCHELEHPATKLLWDIGLKAIDDEVSLSAIRILNHFYIYTIHQKPITCRKGINFIKYCMSHLQSSLAALRNSTSLSASSQALDIMQKVILLIRTHLEVFKAHWSFYLRILQLNSEADLLSHRLSAYDIKFTMTIRLICQAASSMDKTTIEVQASDFIGELRAEIVKWWYSQVDRGYFEQSNSFSPSSSSPSSSSSSTASARGDSKGKQDVPKPSTFGRRRLAKNSLRQLDSFTAFLLTNHHSLRLLSHNQEIPFDWDERQINELDFKDMQVIYVLNDVKNTNIDSADDLNSEKSEESPQVDYYFPEPNSIPSIVLQSQEYFEHLMEANHFLGTFHYENPDSTNKAKTLSRRVWEIIQILPTCPHYKEDLKRCGLDDDNWSLKVDRCSKLLSSECPQKLLYSLQIIDILKSSHECPFWSSTFIRKDGLADLYDVFMSQKLLPDENEEWNEWLQECLAYLLKLLFQFGTKTVHSPNNTDYSSSSSSSKMSIGPSINRSGNVVPNASSAKKTRRNRNRFMGSIEERISIPQFSDELLKLLANTDLIFNKLIRILKSSALCKSQNDQYYYVTMSSRAMIVHHVMNFLSSCCKSDPKFPEIKAENYEDLLRALILDDTDASTRREACNGFFKLHYACLTKSLDASMDSSNASINQQSGSIGTDGSTTYSDNLDASDISSLAQNTSFSADLLATLVKFLPIAEAMKPPKPIRNYVSESDYIREMNSPGSKDYFWLTCRLIDAPNTCNRSSAELRNVLQASDTLLSENSNDYDTNSSLFKGTSPVDLFDLCEYLVVAIRRRQTYETRDFLIEDDALRGMLMMMVMALRRDSTFRYTELASHLVTELYGYLFAPPTELYRFHPKCKSPTTRSTALELMIALVERCPKNYMKLISRLLIDQRQAVVKGSYPTDYWPHDDCRSEVGFVGLVNLGATCYLATCMQHLFMIPDLRYAILSLGDPEDIRHAEIIRELQKIFAFMLESERKAYNPRNFCKVYTMDNHPLNIAEQTDMTEFLTDLITKLEESSPGLRHIIKSLFSGTLSNNVVSLDCPHISRTTEEFYTLRVQVADMRNLNDSLDELTVKDTLEGDNMYTCSTCEKKVRAEKRACIVKLPRILCFNTMRYTFNMATMTKEKVNTHFSFPLRLDMADYLEMNLMKRQQASPTQSDSSSSSSDSPTENNSNGTNTDECFTDMADRKSANASTKMNSKIEDDNRELETAYELIGVTVHTGNADGGHYYCFIRDCEDQLSDKPRWYLFNDAEVKPFDDSHIGTECYGGELTTKSYDAINDRFMDFSIEKTNSAYMLFYKRVDYKYRSKSVALRYLESDTQRFVGVQQDSMKDVESRMDIDESFGNKLNRFSVSGGDRSQSKLSSEQKTESTFSFKPMKGDFDFSKLCEMTYENFKLPQHLSTWVWNDNLKFARDKYIFEHNYFNFMWNICANVPRTLNQIPEDLVDLINPENIQVSEDVLAIETVHLAITFVLGILMNSRERPNLSNWTELIRKQFNTSKAACDWLMQLVEEEETWLKQMLLKCPIEMVRQLFQRLCNDLTGSKQHKKLRLIK